MTMIPFPGHFLGGEREELTTMFPVARLGLRTIAGPLRGQTFMFNGEQMIIGRAQDCDVCIASKGVSRHHARIEYGSGNYWLIPEKTTNGTRLNGVLVTAPSQLADKDQIAVHDSTFVVAVREMADAEMDAAPIAQPPAPAPAPAPPPPQMAQAPTMAMQAQPMIPMAPPPSAPMSAQVPAPYPPPGYSQSYPVQSPTQSYPPGAFPTYQSYPASSFPVPQGYPTRPSMPSMQYPVAAGLASLPNMPPPARTAAWVWILAVIGAIGIIIGVVVVTVKLMQPGAPATAPAPAPSPVPTTAPTPAPAPTAAKVEAAKVEAPKTEPAKAEPPKVEPAKVEAAKVEPAKVEPAKVEAAKADAPKSEAKAEAAKPEPAKSAQKATGTLAVEKSTVMAQLRGTITDVVAVGARLDKDGAIGHARLYSPQFNAAYAKLVQLQKKYGDSEDYADFIDQAKQEFAAAKARRQLKAIASPNAGTVTKVSVRPGTEASEKTAVAEIAVARITVPADAVDGKGKRCTTDLGKEKVFGTMLDVGASERTLELDKVPAAKPGTFDDIKIICAAE